jgi:magnesium transporter
MSMNFAIYQNAQRLPEISFNKINEVLGNPDTFIWLTIKDPTPTQLKRIQAQFQLHELAVEDASSARQRPKLEAYGDTLFIAAHTARLKGEETTHGELHAFIGRQFVILIQHGGTIRYDRVQARCEHAPDLFMNGPGFALYAVLDHLVDQFIVIAGHLQKKLDELETVIFQSQMDAISIESLYELKREVSRLHNAASPIAGICAELFRLHPDIATPELHPYFRDVEDHVERIVRSTIMLREALSDAMQVNLALVTVRQNEVVKRLAGWGAILGIPTMVFSMYGMNFKHMPEYDWSFGYPATLLLTAFACRELYQRLKRSGWL